MECRDRRTNLPVNLLLDRHLILDSVIAAAHPVRLDDCFVVVRPERCRAPGTGHARHVELAIELTAWMQMLSLTGHDARRYEPKSLRLRLFSIAARSPHTAAPGAYTCPRTRPGPTSSQR
jgi:hypothetical protein